MAETINKTQVASGATAKTVPAASIPATRKAPGLQLRRYFTKPGTSPYDQFQWELRTASITDAQGKTIFEQKNVETPKDWSVTATNIVASKYLHGAVGTPERESGVRALVGRVAETIRDWGVNGGYFATRADADTFHDELAYILLDQFRRAKLALESRNGKRTIWRDGLSQSAVLCLLHQFCEGLSRLHPNAGEN